MSDLAFGVLLVTAGAAFLVYSAALGERARARGARFGRELCVPTPLNDAVTALVKGLEASWS